LLRVLEIGIVGAMPLTLRERRVLDLEREWWHHAPTKEQAIREQLSLSPAAYYAALRRLVGSPEAFAYDPLVIARLRRRMRERRRSRFEVGPAMRHRPR
jgi:hypothetical protein